MKETVVVKSKPAKKAKIAKAAKTAKSISTVTRKVSKRKLKKEEKKAAKLKAGSAEKFLSVAAVILCLTSCVAEKITEKKRNN